MIHKEIIEEEKDLVKLKYEKLDILKKLGKDPYSQRFKATHTIEELKKNFREGIEVAVGGRVVARRYHGKAVFMDIKSQATKIQLYARLGTLTEEDFLLFKEIDTGDFVGVEGKTFLTRTAEPSILVQKFNIISKNLYPLPDPYFGIKDIESRYRQRYLDLILHDEVFEKLKQRTRIILLIREFLNREGYIEVETPMLAEVPSGAEAEPFVTYHNTLKIHLYLRIAPELYLKRLIVGGFEKIYELNKNFRNEGISSKHYPEFTMLEVYKAYADYEDMMELTKNMLRYLAKNLFNGLTFQYQGREISLENFKVVEFYKLIEDFIGCPVNEDNIKTITKKFNIYDERLSYFELLDDIIDKVISKELIQPIFIIGYPMELCPLAKRSDKDKNLTERFELYIGGIELANAYSELADPNEQFQRLTNKKYIDLDFIDALKVGMPPTGGLGIGIDRLIMLFTNSSSIKEVILFPQLRPKGIRPELE